MSDDDLDVGSPWLDNVASLEERKKRVSQETVALLESLLGDAKRGLVSGVAIAVLRSNGEYEMRLRGSCSEGVNSIQVTGMLAALQKMALDLED